MSQKSRIMFGDQTKQIHLTGELMKEWGIPSGTYARFRFSNGTEFVNPFKRSYRGGKKIILPKVFREMQYLSPNESLESIELCSDMPHCEAVENVKVKIISGRANKDALLKAIQRQHVFINQQICVVKLGWNIVTCQLDAGIEKGIAMFALDKRLVA